jgi:hypothetical protein
MSPYALALAYAVGLLGIVILFSAAYFTDPDRRDK